MYSGALQPQMLLHCVRGGDVTLGKDVLCVLQNQCLLQYKWSHIFPVVKKKKKRSQAVSENLYHHFCVATTLVKFC